VSDETLNPEEVTPEAPAPETSAPEGETKEGTQDSPAAVNDDQKPEVDEVQPEVKPEGDSKEAEPEIDGIDKYLSQFAKAPPEEKREPENATDARFQEMTEKNRALAEENDRLRAGKPDPVAGLEDFPDEVQAAFAAMRKDIVAEVRQEFSGKMDVAEQLQTEKQMESEVSQIRGIVGAERFDDAKVQGSIGQLLKTIEDNPGSMVPLHTLADAAEKTISGSEYRRGVADAEARMRRLASSASDGVTSPVPEQTVDLSWSEFKEKTQRENPGFNPDL